MLMLKNIGSKIKMAHKSIKIIKEQLKILVDSGYIYEVADGKYRGLGRDDDFYLEIRGDIK